MHDIILLILEHIPPDVLQRHISLEMISGIHDRIYVPRRLRDLLYQFSQSRINLHRHEVRLDQVTGLQKGKDSLVTVVCEKFSLLGDSFGIYRVRLDCTCGRIGHCRSKDKRNKKVISSGHVRNKEDRRHRRLHNAGHKSGHSYQHEVLLRYNPASCNKIYGP